MVKFSGASRKYQIFKNFAKYWWVQTKQFTSLLEFIKLCTQNPLDKLFTIYPNYTLALMSKLSDMKEVQT